MWYTADPKKRNPLIQKGTRRDSFCPNIQVSRNTFGFLADSEAFGMLFEGQTKEIFTENLACPALSGWYKKQIDLWQNYAKCHFGYFFPKIMICDQSNKFGRLFTKSLKKAPGLPIHLLNEALLRVAGVLR